MNKRNDEEKLVRSSTRLKQIVETLKDVLMYIGIVAIGLFMLREGVKYGLSRFLKSAILMAACFYWGTVYNLKYKNR